MTILSQEANLRLRWSWPFRAYKSIQELSALYRWRRNECRTVPPNIVKRQAVAKFGEKYQLKTLVETGTFLGEMIYANRNRFNRIISVELDPLLHRLATERFRQYPYIDLRCGDSREVLSNILSEITEPALFWLDAHFSGGFTARGEEDTPIIAELVSLLSHPVRQHVILIDDARHFTGQDGYPSTQKIQEILTRYDAPYKMSVENDIIQIIPS